MLKCQGGEGGESMLLKKKTLEKGVCFFDIDGVLNTSGDWSRQYTFRKDLVANLCTFARERNLDLVMTSSWRTGFTSFGAEDNLPHIKCLEQEFRGNGVLITGKTPVFKGKARDLEISRYLAYHPYERLIVIDDDRSEYSSVDGLTVLLTDSAKGFDKETLKKAMKLV